jgi:pyrroloquinoline quinone biosynthesis protein D
VPRPPLESSARLRLASKARLRWDEREHAHLLLYPERGLLLNATGSAIVKLLDGTRDLERLTRDLAASLTDGAPTQLASEVREFLERLRDRGLLEELP